MVIQGFSYISKMATIGRVTSVLQIPVQYIYLAFPLGAGFMLIHFIVTEGRELRKMFSGAGEGKEIIMASVLIITIALAVLLFCLLF